MSNDAVTWTRTSEKTAGGHTLTTTYVAEVGPLKLAVTNWPGSRTLSWEITIPGKEFRQGGDEDRFEYTVRSLKVRSVERAEQILRVLEAK